MDGRHLQASRSTGEELIMTTKQLKNSRNILGNCVVGGKSGLHIAKANRLGIGLIVLVLIAGLASTASAGATFQGATFQGATFQGATFQGATFQGATFQGATFQGATFQGATFQGATFQGATFQGATFQGATFQGATLRIFRRAYHLFVR